MHAGTDHLSTGKTDFLSDLRNITAQKLKEAIGGADPNQSLLDLLYAYYTIEERRIDPQPRRVLRAPEFDAAVASLTPVQAAAAAEIERKLRTGADANGHLNLRSLDPSEPDALLVDWWVHHLHLSLAPHKRDGRFLDRTGLVAFAHITAHDVYFLTILEHGHWADRDLFAILARRFPEAVEKFELRGVPPDPNITEEIVNECRKVGAAYVIAVDGKSYRPVSFAGSPNLSQRAWQRAEHMVRHVTALQEATLTNMESIRAEAPAIAAVASPEFELVNDAGGFLVKEKFSGQNIRIQWPTQGSRPTTSCHV